MSRERAKLSYRWQPAVVERWATVRGRLVRHEETGESFRVPCCPDCHDQIVDKDGVLLLGRDLARRKRWCPECGSALWQADRSGPKRYPLAVQYVFGGHCGGPSCASTHSRMYRLAPISEGRHLSPRLGDRTS